MPLLFFKATCLLNLVTGIVRQSRRDISHKGRSAGKINAVSAVSVISMVLWIINASVEYGGMTLTRDLCMNWPPCSDADNGFGELRPSLILACKSQPASNGLHLERSEFMCKSFWRTKLVVWFFFPPKDIFLWWRGLAVGVHSSDLALTLARCPPTPICMCVHALVCTPFVCQVFGECLHLIGNGRHFVGLYCHMPLPILLLIRAAITGTPTWTRALTRQTLAHAQSSGLCMWLASHCVVLCADQTEHGVVLLSRPIGGSDGYDVAPLLFNSSGCCQLRQCQICS